MIVVWGEEDCELCNKTYEALDAAGHQPEKKSFQNELHTIHVAVQREIMAAYCLTNAFPVIQIGEKAFTVAEAQKELGYA